MLATVAKQKDELLAAKQKIASLSTKQKIVLLAAKQKDAPPTVKPRDVPPATRQKGEPVVAKQNVELLGALKELQESLMFANENPACGINGTIWMLRGNKTLFDFIDETIAVAEKTKKL